MNDHEHSFDSESPQAASFQPAVSWFHDLSPIRPDVRLAPVADDRLGTTTRRWLLPVPPGAESAQPMEDRSGAGQGIPGRESSARSPRPYSYLDTPVKSGLTTLKGIESPCLISTLEQFRDDKLGLAEFLLSKGEKRKAAEVRSCGDYLEIGWDGKAMRSVTIDRGDQLDFQSRPGSARVLGGELCDQYKICPVCAHIMAMRRFAKVLPQVQCLLHDPQAALIPVLVTLTVKNGHDLPERYRHLMDSLNKVHQLAKNSRKGQRWTEFARIHGALWSTEFTFSHETGWHPHLHGVCLVKQADIWSWIDDTRHEGWHYPFPFNVSAMRDDWRSITGDSHVLHVRPFDMASELINDPAARKTVCSDPDRLAGGLLEALKYATKIVQGNYDQRWTVAQSTHAKHLVRRWGCLRKVEPCPVLQRKSSPPFVGAFAWSSKAGRYELEHVRGWDHTRDSREEPDE